MFDLFVNVRELTFDYAVAVVDLDPKGIERVDKYVHEDRAILDMYLALLENDQYHNQ